MPSDESTLSGRAWRGAPPIEVGRGDRPAHVRLGTLEREPVAQPAEGRHEARLHEVGGVVGVAAQQVRVAHEGVAALGDERFEHAFPAGPSRLLHVCLPILHDPGARRRRAPLPSQTHTAR